VQNPTCGELLGISQLDPGCMKTARFASNAVVMPSLEFHPNTTIPGHRPEAAAMVEAFHTTLDFAIHIASTYHSNHSKIMLLGELGMSCRAASRELIAAICRSRLVERQ
jgi:hypothetical protein